MLQSCVLTDLPHACAWHQATGSSPRPRDCMSSPAVTLLWRREWPHRRSSLLVLLPLLVLSVSSVQRLHEPKGQSKEPPPSRPRQRTPPKRPRQRTPKGPRHRTPPQRLAARNGKTYMHLLNDAIAPNTQKFHTGVCEINAHPQHCNPHHHDPPPPQFQCCDKV